MQVQTFQQRLFSGAHFTAKQKLKMASFWYHACKVRHALDSSMNEARALLLNLPVLDDIPSKAIGYIAGLASGVLPIPDEDSPAPTTPLLFGTGVRRVLHRLLGIDSASVELAAAALRALQEYQEEELRQQNELMAAMLIPLSPAFPTSCHAYFWTMLMENSTLRLDHLHLCKSAAEEERHGVLFQNPLSASGSYSIIDSSQQRS
jgi:hypothetical protein